jgi:hypothetical protein
VPVAQTFTSAVPYHARKQRGPPDFIGRSSVLRHPDCIGSTCDLLGDAFYLLLIGCFLLQQSFQVTT